jgi:hypothetical protein
MKCVPRTDCFRVAFGTLIMALLLMPISARGKRLEPAQIKALPECSLAKTNWSCKLVIDRRNPVSPPVVQMYSDQALTVIVKNPLPYERYFLDYQTGQATLSPDVTASIVQGLIPSMGKIQILAETHRILPGKQACAKPEIANPEWLPEAKHVNDALPIFQDCLAQLAGQAMGVYRALEPFVAPDSLTPDGSEQAQGLDVLQRTIGDFLTTESVMSAKITSIAGCDALKKSAVDAPAVVRLGNLQKLADAVATDLLGYSQRISDLAVLEKSSHDCSDVINVTSVEAQNKTQCVSITSNSDLSGVYHGMVTRAVTYSLNTLNLISNSQEAVPDPAKKKSLASIAVSFADKPVSVSRHSLFSPLRWEASAGVFFSNLPDRSFSVSPVYTNGVVTDHTVAQKLLRPTVVPFAAANYRLTNDLKWTRWKSNIYWTFGIGINPNTVSADFGTGPSISWRSLMLSGLWHIGHDVRLNQGFHAGQSLGASFSGTLPTESYWRATAFAIAVSVRIPTLSGR